MAWWPVAVGDLMVLLALHQIQEMAAHMFLGLGWTELPSAAAGPSIMGFQLLLLPLLLLSVVVVVGPCWVTWHQVPPATLEVHELKSQLAEVAMHGGSQIGNTAAFLVGTGFVRARGPAPAGG